MNDKDLEKKIELEMERQIEERGYATPSDLLMALRFLDKKKYEDWLSGKVPYLEKVITLGPQKVLRLLSVMSAYAKKNGYKAKVEKYERQFSHSANSVIEAQFSTHYVDKYWRED